MSAASESGRTGIVATTYMPDCTGISSGDAVLETNGMRLRPRTEVKVNTGIYEDEWCTCPSNRGETGDDRIT